MRFLVTGLGAIKGRHVLFSMFTADAEKPEDIVTEYNSHKGSRFILLNCLPVSDDYELPEANGDEIAFTLDDL